MKQLYAPWRSSYIREPSQECPFCIPVSDENLLKTRQEGDAERFILVRYKSCFVMLNRYPYNAGHVLVVPYAHVSSLSDLTPVERAELIEATTMIQEIISATLGNDAANIGLNLGGTPAGGTVPGHLHMHVVPRWCGDTGFLAVLADTKPISFNLYDIYDRLARATDERFNP